MSWKFTNLDVTRKFTSELNYCNFSLIVSQDPHNSDRNRGFAFVEYYNHACAENARRKLSMPGFKFGTNTPTVNWAEERGGGPESSIAMSHVMLNFT